MGGYVFAGVDRYYYVYEQLPGANSKSDCHQNSSIIPLATGVIKFWKVNVGGEPMIDWLIDETQVPSNHTDIVVTDVTYQPAVKYFVILQSRVYVSNYVRHLPQRSILVGTIILFTDDVARDFVWFYCQPSQRESMFADGALAAGIGMTRTCSRRLQ